MILSVLILSDQRYPINLVEDMICTTFLEYYIEYGVFVEQS